MMNSAKIASGATMSASQSYDFDLTYSIHYAFQIKTSGGPTGIMTAYGRVDSSADFIPVSGSTYVFSGSTNINNFFFQDTDVPYREVRLNWVASGNSGLLDAYVSVKGHC